MEIKFKKDYEQKLKDVRRQFIHNIKTHYITSSISLDTKIKELNDSPDFANFINNAFTWSLTPEGSDFWMSIKKRFIILIN